MLKEVVGPIFLIGMIMVVLWLIISTAFTNFANGEKDRLDCLHTCEPYRFQQFIHDENDKRSKCVCSAPDGGYNILPIR